MSVPTRAPGMPPAQPMWVCPKCGERVPNAVDQVWHDENGKVYWESRPGPDKCSAEFIEEASRRDET